MTLRPADAGEAWALAELHARAFDHPWPAQDIAELLASPGAFALVAEDERLAGFILCRAIAGEAEILTLAVDPAARRRGLARAMVEACAGLARAAQADVMFLEVSAGNLPAIGLYEGAGFVQVGVRSGYYDLGAGERADALVMRLELGHGS
ncbi:ribosomal protein S18-alanine N-acetyltransferase [Phenylobacterium koreense]|uniref:[Ribosomal protein bS18]-alanine N-acetyltransferase n=2 Tax=Phenylobacterium TaxID=20 RepID=A0ABV2EIT2_9CAUL